MTERVLAVLAPLRGWCDSLTDVPDPVFSNRTLGDGVSIDPTDGTVTAPFDAEILTLPASAHAVSLRAENGAEVLIHFGIDTVALSGDGFEAHVKQGDRVRCGERLLSVAMDRVLRRVPSLRSPVLLLNGDRFEMRSVRSAGPVERDDAIFELRRRPATGAAVRDSGSRAAARTRELVVGLEHGVHARPAAAVIEALRHFEAEVEIRSASGRASARSAVSMMALGIGHGEALTIAARGPDADAVLKAIAPLFRPLPPTSTHEAPDARRSRAIVAAPAAGSVLRAKSASVGLAFGPAARLDAAVAVAGGPAGEPAEERKRLDDAVASVRASLQALADGRRDAARDIALAHVAMLEDPTILGAARERIGQGDSAASAWHAAVRESSDALSKLEDRRMRERMDDLADIDQRVLRALAGQPPDGARDLPAGAIVIADNLLPSQLLALEPGSFAGICTAAGGVTSHVAILAASLGKPMLVAAGDSVLRIDDGTVLCVDADNGELHVAPDPEAIAAFRQRVAAEGIRRQHELRSAADPCILADGSPVHVLANVASVEDMRDALRLGAEGCGLFRTEFLFMGRAAAPGASEQLVAYREVAEALGDRQLIVRLLDVGGDKPIGYVSPASEENPALGVRGVRLTLRHSELLETQLEALCRLSRLRPLDVMIPMVTSVDEVQAVRSILAAASERIGKAHGVRLGIMIETPAAALLADRLARIADFFSIGTNDLTQYTLAMDRGDPAFAGSLDPLQPAVLQLVARTAAAARDAGIPVGVCGAAAGDPQAAALLLGYGIRELSMVASLIPRLKATLRGLDPAACRSQASAALDMSSAAEVRASVRELLLRERTA